MTSSAKLVISIVAYNSDPTELASSIESAHRTSHPHEVIVVDNSPDTSLERVVVALGAAYMKTPANRGFGAAHNIVLRDALEHSPFCLILNPDCSFDDGVLDELIEFLMTNDDVGLVMPRILYPDGSEQKLCKLLPNPLNLISRRFGGKLLKSFSSEAMKRFECGRVDLSRPTNIPYLSGCFMLMCTAALKRVGLFDEQIFMYLEDLDLCRRIHRGFPLFSIRMPTLRTGTRGGPIPIGNSCERTFARQFIILANMDGFSTGRGAPSTWRWNCRGMVIGNVRRFPATRQRIDKFSRQEPFR